MLIGFASTTTTSFLGCIAGHMLAFKKTIKIIAQNESNTNTHIDIIIIISKYYECTYLYVLF